MTYKLFTPGPLSTASETKASMLHDWPSRDVDFEAITRSVLNNLEKIYQFDHAYACVLLQGPSTFAIEATITTLVKKQERILALSNGVYGDRMYQIAKLAGYQIELISLPFDQPINEKSLDNLDLDYSEFDYVTFVHCETSTGILNDIVWADQFSHKNKLKLIADTVSTFGGMTYPSFSSSTVALIGSANKCLESVPGITFVFIKEKQLIDSKDNCTSISFDLFSQWQYMEEKSQWRFSPPTHVVAAFNTALSLFHRQGGVKARAKRYKQNYQFLTQKMTSLGFKALLQESTHSPIIVSYLMGTNIDDFNKLYSELKQKGLVIYPGVINNINYFRVGCIGDISIKDIESLTSAFQSAIKQET
ncbi:2-aminoethylphosphonate--pyruvate transaminase [uncultured Shewanella sp.]|uniref:2-aminoethylphosphonate--pyruvate transaminase n=1 Tax=uncultured Shewanella sp. TaxID=173975 RepID=UPI00260255E1|nr:2-aminoethylphosphonate--pyruvate transaminase [uncultured Shewanella sp.]